MAVRDANGAVRIVPATAEKEREAEFIMLRDGLIIFEGDADALRRSDDPYIKDVPVLRKDSMPRTRSLAWSELKIGVLTIVAVAIAASTDFRADRTRGFFWQRYTLKTRFANVAGLAKGSPVRVAGVEVGSVKAVEFAGEQVDIVFDMRKDMRDRITTGSLARLGSVSLLGESAIDITPSTRGHADSRVGLRPAGKAPLQIADITEQASASVDEITGLVHDLRAGRGTVGKLMTDEQLYTELQPVRRDRRRRDADDQAGARHARQAAQRSADGRRARGQRLEPRGR